jgi:hypothetical protein
MPLALISFRGCVDYPTLLSRRYRYFEVVAGLVWSNDQEICDGSVITTGRVSHASQVEGDDPNK